MTRTRPIDGALDYALALRRQLQTAAGIAAPDAGHARDDELRAVRAELDIAEATVAELRGQITSQAGAVAQLAQQLDGARNVADRLMVQRDDARERLAAANTAVCALRDELAGRGGADTGQLREELAAARVALARGIAAAERDREVAIVAQRAAEAECAELRELNRRGLELLGQVKAERDEARGQLAQPSRAYRVGHAAGVGLAALVFALPAGALIDAVVGSLGGWPW
jgi:hypothetical protein